MEIPDKFHLIVPQKFFLAPRCSLHHTVSTSIDSFLFAQVTANIIKALLCLAKYSLLDKMVHPAAKCFIVSSCLWHTRHLPSSIIAWTAFQDQVSTICSNNDMIDNIFRWWRFWVSQRWHSSSCSLKNLICCSLD